MKRVLLTLSGLLVLALFVRLRAGEGPAAPAGEETVEEGRSDVPMVMPSAVKKDEVKETSASTSPAQGFVPTFFPKARVVAVVTDPADAQGRRKEIETVETNMKERYVRVVRTFNSAGGRRVSEVAMVANQLMLEKPDGVDASAFTKMLREAGALEVKALNEEAYLATFASRPEDPHALDSYMSRVKEVAGADVTVEPNYIRKMF